MDGILKGDAMKHLRRFKNFFREISEPFLKASEWAVGFPGTFRRSLGGDIEILDGVTGFRVV